MLVLKAFIRLAERVTLSKFGASEQSSAVNRQAKVENATSRGLTIKFCLNIVERLSHHELEAVIRHNLCFMWVVIGSNWMVHH